MIHRMHFFVVSQTAQHEATFEQLPAEARSPSEKGGESATTTISSSSTDLPSIVCQHGRPVTFAFDGESTPRGHRDPPATTT
jgi:hypothetical protein